MEECCCLKESRDQEGIPWVRIGREDNGVVFGIFLLDLYINPYTILLTKVLLAIHDDIALFYAYSKLKGFPILTIPSRILLLSRAAAIINKLAPYSIPIAQKSFYFLCCFKRDMMERRALGLQRSFTLMPIVQNLLLLNKSIHFYIQLSLP